MDAVLQRVAPLTGIVFVALYAVAAVLAITDAPDFLAPGVEIVDHYDERADQIRLATLLAAIAAPFYIWFLGCLRTAIALAEGGPTRLASTAFGAGVASLATGLAGAFINALGAMRVHEEGQVAAEVATVYYDVGLILAFVATPAAVAGLLLATAIASLRHGAPLPGRLAAATIPVAIVCVIPPIAFAGLGLALIWVVIVSALLYRGRVAIAATAP